MRELLDNNFCEIHKYPMTKEKVKIIYGYPIRSIVGYSEERKIYFPNCDDHILGGCCVKSVKYEEKYICEICNIEREKWKNFHKTEICFKINRNIIFPFDILINGTNINNIISLFVNENLDNYIIKIISIPNGKYNISINSKFLKGIEPSINIILKNNYIDLYLDYDKNKITLRIGEKRKVKMVYY